MVVMGCDESTICFSLKLGGFAFHVFELNSNSQLKASTLFLCDGVSEKWEVSGFLV